MPAPLQDPPVVATMDDGNRHVAHDALPGALGRPLCSASEFKLAAELTFARLVPFFGVFPVPSREVFVLGQDLGFEGGVFVVGAHDCSLDVSPHPIRAPIGRPYGVRWRRWMVQAGMDMAARTGRLVGSEAHPKIPWIFSKEL